MLFYTPQGLYPDDIIKAALWNVDFQNDDAIKFNENGLWDVALHCLLQDKATVSYVVRVYSTSLSNQNWEDKVHFSLSLG